jgi:hypothetical protein
LITEVISVAVAAWPHTPGHEMSPAAAMTGSEPLRCVGEGDVVGVGDAVRVGESVGIGDAVGMGDAVGLGAAVGLADVVPGGVGVGRQCGLCGFGR